MSHENQIEFPCRQRPEEPGIQRLLGIYGQRQEGLHMQRVKAHGGRITAAQLIALAALADAYTPGYPLHVTTRQDVELHGVRPEDVPRVQQGIAEVGLTTLGACGDTLRNVTTCPGNGLAAGSFDLSALADAIKAAAESLPFIREMPRKFKISISACPQACAKPWINCLGFVARPEGTFRAIGAGSLGQRPVTGIELYESLEVSEVVTLVVASLRLFNDEGDRERRHRARFRHVRERLGDAEFRRRLDAHFRRAVEESSWPVPDVEKVAKSELQRTQLHFPLGDVTPRQAFDLADAVEAARGNLRLGFEHDVLIYAVPELKLPGDLQRLRRGPRIVACPGTTWCSRGLANSRELERTLRQHSGTMDGLSIAMSGCPNNCAHAAVADIGLIGRIKTVGGRRTECFRLLAGGGKGFTPDLGVELHPAVPAVMVPGIVAWLAGRAGDTERASAALHGFVRCNQCQLRRKIERAVARGSARPAR
jgi:sulfite reductase (NADPH) hemoprotein beta-component